MNKLPLLAAVLAALAMTACTPVIDTLARGDAKRPPKYQAKTATRFGDWYSEPGSCILNGNSPEVRTVTNGEISDGSIELRMNFAAPLAARPRVSLNNYPVALTLEGAGQTYTLQLPYGPPAVARYLQGDTFLTVSYQPASSEQPFEVNFATSGLVSGLTYLGRTCK